MLFGGKLVYGVFLQVGSNTLRRTAPDGFEAVLTQTGQQVVDRDVGVSRDEDGMRDLPVFLLVSQNRHESSDLPSAA